MGVVVSASDAAVQVAPGAVGVLTLRIRNTGGIVEGFGIEALGELAPFVDVNPPLVNVLPGQDGTATVTIRPPRASQPAAGAYALGLRVRGRQDPTASSVEEVHVTVTPFVAVDLRVVPQNAKGRRSATLRAEIGNTGNAPAAIRMVASDPDDALAMNPAQQALTLAAGERAVHSIVMRSRNRPFRGQPEQHPFTVSALGPDGTGPTFTGQYKQLPVMPSLAVSGGSVAALIAAGAAVFVVTQNNAKKDDNSAAAVTTVVGQGPVSTVATGGGSATTAPGGGGGGGATTAAPAAPAGLKTSVLTTPLTLGSDVDLSSGGGAYLVQATGGNTKVPGSAKQVLVAVSLLPPEVTPPAPTGGGGGGSMIDPSKIRNLSDASLRRQAIVIPDGAKAPGTAAPAATTGTLVAGPSGGDARVVMSYATGTAATVLTTVDVPADGQVFFAAANGSAPGRFSISVVGWLSPDGTGGPSLIPTTRVAADESIATNDSITASTAAVKLPKGNILSGLVLVTAHGGPIPATITVNDGQPIAVPGNNQVISAVVSVKWAKTLTVKADADVAVDLDVFGVVVDKGPGFTPLVADLQASAPPAAGVPIGLDVAKAGVPATASSVLVQLTADGASADQLDLFTGTPDQRVLGVIRYGPGHPGSATVVARVSAEGKVVVHTSQAGTVTARLLGWYG